MSGNGELSDRELEAQEGFIDVQNEIQAWLEEIEAERVDIHCNGVGLLGFAKFWKVIQGVVLKA